LCVSGLVVLTRPSSVAPNEARDRESWSAGLQRERMDHNVDTSWKAR